MPLTSLRTTIDRIGKQMVACDERCEGASNALNDTPPRCLYLEVIDSEDVGVVVVGLNPGRASRTEVEFYKKEGISYPATTKYLERNMPSIMYYTRMREVLKRLNLHGSILWTEVAKCELLCGVSEVSLDMQRRCTAKYLKRELEACAGWPILATGRQAFHVAALLAPDRGVIGVPHPTGAWGSAFDNATGNTKTGLTSDQKASVATAVATKKAIWLGTAEA